jgi:hypothetical protein
MTQALVRSGYIVAIGEKRWPVQSLEEASALFVAARERWGEGASRTPTPMVLDADGTLIGHISYNGRVWAGDAGNWKPGTIPIHDPL